MADRARASPRIAESPTAIGTPSEMCTVVLDPLMPRSIIPRSTTSEAAHSVAGAAVGVGGVAGAGAVVGVGADGAGVVGDGVGDAAVGAGDGGPHGDGIRSGPGRRTTTVLGSTTIRLTFTAILISGVQFEGRVRRFTQVCRLRRAPEQNIVNQPRGANVRCNRYQRSA